MKGIKFISKYWPWLLTALVLVAVIISSIKIYKEEVLNIDPDVEYTTKTTIRIPATKIDTLNPLISNSEDMYYISKLIYDSLFSYDENMAAKENLVESYKVNTDRAFVDIQLRDGVKWHNGRDLNANDVAFTISAIKAAGVKSPYYEKVRKINSCHVRGADSLSIYFNNNYNCSLDDLIFPIVPTGQYASASQFANARSGFKPLGTGKYMYKSYNSKKKMKLIPYEDFAGTPAENNLEVVILPEKNLAANMMDIEEVTCYIDDSPNRKSTANDKKYMVWDIPSNKTDFIAFNCYGLYTNLKEFRQAVAYGMDSDKILGSAYMEDGIQTDTIYFPNFLGVADTGDHYKFDEKKAREMLAKLGYKDINDDGLLEGSRGENITLEILVNKDNPMRNVAAKLIKKNLGKIGINSNISSLEEKEYERAIKGKKFNILITGYTFEAGYDLRSFFNGKNPWGYTDYPLNQKVLELDRLYSGAEYVSKFEDIKTAIIDELPYYPLCHKKMSLIGLPTLEAEQLPIFDDIYRNCDTWSWKVQVKKE